MKNFTGRGNGIAKTVGAGIEGTDNHSGIAFYKFSSHNLPVFIGFLYNDKARSVFGRNMHLDGIGLGTIVKQLLQPMQPVPL